MLQKHYKLFKTAQKQLKQHYQDKIANVCVTVCVYNAQEWIYMFSPIQTAHGPEAMPSCPGAFRESQKAHGQGHMVQKQYDTNDIEESELVIETFKFIYTFSMYKLIETFVESDVWYFTLNFYRKSNLSEVGS